MFAFNTLFTAEFLLRYRFLSGVLPDWGSNRLPLPTDEQSNDSNIFLSIYKLVYTFNTKGRVI